MDPIRISNYISSLNVMNCVLLHFSLGYFSQWYVGDIVCLLAHGLIGAMATLNLYSAAFCFPFGVDKATNNRVSNDAQHG